MPRIATETFAGTGDMRWLASNHGITNARTGSLAVADFTAKAPNGYIPAGTPVNAADEAALKPWTGTGDLGFILFDQYTSGANRLAVPVLRHGTIRIGNLPGEGFTKPESGAEGFTFITKAQEIK